MGTDGTAVVEQTTEKTSTVLTEAVGAEVQLKEKVQPDSQVTQDGLVIDKTVSSFSEDSVTVTDKSESSLAVSVKGETVVQDVQQLKESPLTAAAVTVTAAPDADTA